MLEEAHSWAGARRIAAANGPDARSTWDALLADHTQALDRRRQAWDAWREAERLAALQAPPPDELAYNFSVHGRRLKGWFEDVSALRRAAAAGQVDAQRLPRLLEVLQAWTGRRHAARAEQRADELRAAAERRSDATDEVRRRLLAATAPDLDAVAYKLSLLPQILDDVWDFCDPKILGDVLAGDIPDRETAAVAAIYFDVLRLNGRAATAERMRRKAELAHRAKLRKPS